MEEEEEEVSCDESRTSDGSERSADSNQKSNPMEEEEEEVSCDESRTSDGSERSAGKREDKNNQYGKDFVLTLSPAYFENVRVSVGSAPSEAEGAPEISEEVVDRPHYRPLLQAAFKGDWESAKRILDDNPASKVAKITGRSDTVLHIAALSEQDQFLENMVKFLSPYPGALEMVDCDGRTALHNAVLCGRIRMVKALVGSNSKLTQLPDREGRIPLGTAAREASIHKDITWFLAKNTTDDELSRPFSSASAIDFILDLTYAGYHDITLYLVGRYPHLMTMKSKKHEGKTIMYSLAVLQSHFPSGTRLSVLEALIYKCIPVDLNYKPTDKSSDPELQSLTRSLWNAAKIVVPIIKRVHEVKLRHVAAVDLANQVCSAISYMSTPEITQFLQKNLLRRATRNGISEVVKLCIQRFPDLILNSRHSMKLMVLAVKRRQERTLGLFLKISSTNELSLVQAPTWKESEQMMIAAATYVEAKYYPNFDAVTNVAGAAFQMQRELQWFKAVESWNMPNMRTRYYKRKTFWNTFVENHKNLLKSGEKWVKGTANSCMLVSTLIATVLFAAAFTVPGGYEDKTGVPLLLGNGSLLVFVISDALGLFSSVMAILLFLAILTSRYEPQDFLESLPKKIIMGLCFLFLSLASMLVAFAATLTIMLEWVLIPIALLISLLVALFIALQLPLLYHMVKSTYGPSIFRAEDIWK